MIISIAGILEEVSKDRNINNVNNEIVLIDLIINSFVLSYNDNGAT